MSRGWRRPRWVGCCSTSCSRADYPFVNDALPKKRQAAIINDLAERYSMTEVAQVLDRLKDAGFYWATRSGVTIAIDDVVVPPNKQAILDGYEAKADQVNRRYQRGALSHQERNDEMVKIWSQASEEVAKAMEDNFPPDNPIPLIVQSGAAGNMTQVRQLAGMRGLVANPKGEYIPRPIKSNFREGLSVLEYFISTHGTRKGLADTALRTADSGYLTRRLVDVSQDVIVREVDCGTERAITMPVTEETADGRLIPHRYIRTSVYARTSAEDVVGPDGELVVAKGDDLGDPALDALVAAGVKQIKVRSALTCTSTTGICGMCYGRSMATGKLVDVGEAVGIVAAQSIGEPGTQLTMRTFHTGGVAGDDITTGLPRVQELFEARVPRGKAPIADVDGRIRIEDGDRFWKITLIPDDGSDEIVYEKLSKRQWLAMTVADGQERPLADGDHVTVGQLLLEGTADPHEVLRVMGPREVQLHLVREVQKVYRTQSVDIHDKHIEVIVRQMVRRVTIIDSGSTEFLPGGSDRPDGLRDLEPPGGCRGRRAGLGSPGADGDHEGLAGDGVVAVRGVVPGDHPDPHRCRDQRKARQARRAQGERDHRQADPGRYGHQPVPQHPGPADRGGPRGRLRPAELRRRLLQPGRVRHGHRCRRAAGRLRLRPRLPLGCEAGGSRPGRGRTPLSRGGDRPRPAYPCPSVTSAWAGSSADDSHRWLTRPGRGGHRSPVAVAGPVRRSGPDLSEVRQEARPATYSRRGRSGAAGGLRRRQPGNVRMRPAGWAVITAPQPGRENDGVVRDPARAVAYASRLSQMS